MKRTIVLGSDQDDAINKNSEVQKSETPLIHEKLLSEFSGDEKPLVLENLGVYPKDKVMTIDETKAYVSEQIRNGIDSHVGEEDPHGFLDDVADMLSNYVKTDGSNGFTNRVKGITPIEENDLATKKYVDDSIVLHEKKDDPHGTLKEVKELLKSYATVEDTAMKSLTYTKDQVAMLIKDFIDVNASKGFLKPVLGKYPLLNDHLSTKRYVDDVFSLHIQNDDHNIAEKIQNSLIGYVKADSVYKKEETYSRPQINAKIEEIARPVVDSMMREHLLADDPHGILKTVREMNPVRSDGSVAFTSPQKGVAGKSSNDFVIKKQLDDEISRVLSTITDGGATDRTWTPSGPVQATVGLVNKGTQFNEPMSLQQVIDAFFYGKSLSIEVPDYCQYGDSVDINITVRPTSMIDDVKVYQGDKLIGQYGMEDFSEDGCIVEKSLPITNGCEEFKLEVTFTNSSKCVDYDTCCVAYAVYVGAMPKWLAGSSTSIDYLNSLCNSDPINNKKFFNGNSTCKYNISYKFNSPEEPKSIFIGMPIDYPSLDYILTRTQQISADEFVTIDNIPYTMPDGEIVMYKLFIFPEGITKMNMDVLYKLDCDE